MGDPEVVTLRCLIVDDSQLFLEGASALLEREGVDVIGVATHSAEALRLVEELRPDATVVVLRFRQLKLGQDVADVLLDGSFGEPELTGDAGVGTPLRHEGENLLLSRRECRERVFRSTYGDEGLHETRVDDRTAAGN